MFEIRFTSVLVLLYKKNTYIRVIGRNLGKIDTPNTLLHDHSLSWLGTGTSIKSGRVK